MKRIAVPAEFFRRIPLFLASFVGVLSLLAVYSAPVTVRACGLVGGPTMIANGHPAIPNPTHPSVNRLWTPGLFTDDFIINQPVKFAEDIPAAALPPGQGPLKLRWNFGDGILGDGDQLVHEFHQPGQYQVWSQFFDPITRRWLNLDGSELEVLVSPVINPPIVHASADNSTVQIGGTVRFSNEGSTARVGSIRRIEWNFGDGGGSNEAQPTHRFTQAGKSKVVLIVTDSRGARATDSLTITITIPLPIARLSLNSTHATVNEVLTFDASRSEASGPDEQVDAFQWNFGDGSLPIQQHSAQITHQYRQPGTYLVILKVADSTGAVNQTQQTVTISAGQKNSFVLPGLLVGIMGLLLGLLAILHKEKRPSEKAQHKAN